MRTTAALALALCAGALAGPIAIDGVTFTDLDLTGDVDFLNPRGAIGVIDADNDGYMDLIFGDQPGSPTTLFLNVPDPDGPGGRAFVNATAGSGLDDADGTARSGGGLAVADYDNDGDQDVYLVGRLDDGSHGLLYRNDAGVFTNVSVASGIRASGFGPQTAAWIDHDLDGDLDLFIAGAADDEILRFYENNGDGTFTDASHILPTVLDSANVYAQIACDVDADGWTDLLVIDVGGPTDLRNVPDGSAGRMFIDAASTSGFDRTGPAPMGMSAADWDNDGDFDLALTNGDIGAYYENTPAALVEVTPFATFFGWGIHWIDADNDRDLDNYQAGSLGQGANADRLIRNDLPSGWTDISPALNAAVLVSRYSVRVDFDNDGREDVVTVNPSGGGRGVSLYHNLSTTGHNWLKIRAVGGAGANTDAIGAEIRLVDALGAQLRQVVSGSSTASTEDMRAHFGLGALASADRIEIRWPRAGSIEERTDWYAGPFAANQILTLHPRCPGDTDGDNAVTFADLNAILADFGNAGPFLRGDANQDGAVDFSDLNALLSAFGQPCD